MNPPDSGASPDSSILPDGAAPSDASPDAPLDSPDAPTNAGPISAAEYLALSAPLFDPNHVLQVVINMDPTAWDSLRNELNNPLVMFAGDCQAGPPQRTFNSYMATVSIDGAVLTNVGIRKKGFMASLSSAKPSLKLDFDKYVAGREFKGTEGITLNNVRQDATQIKTCLAFNIFRQAGLPAPRCNFASVTVNGQNLGVYVHVENVSKRMLALHFSNRNGHRYEGLWSDFRERFINTFEAKTDGANYTDLDAIKQALTLPDEQRLAAVSALVDLDKFMTLWAAENLIGSWDGYSNSLNNYFVYFDPTSAKAHFLPWGPDWAFTDHDVFTGEGRPPSISAHGYLSHQLYKLAAGRTMYRAKLEQLLQTVWTESAILAEIDRMKTLIEPYVDNTYGRWQPALADLRTWVGNRRAALDADLANWPVAWNYPLKQPPCISVAGTVSGTFSTSWDTYHNGTADELAQGTGTMIIDMPGRLQTSSLVAGAAAGWDDKRGLGPRPIAAVGGVFPDTNVYAVGVLVTPEKWRTGQKFPFDWQSSVGGLVKLDPQTGAIDIIGTLYDGEVTLDATSYTPGQPVTGSFRAVVMVGAWDSE